MVIHLNKKQDKNEHYEIFIFMLIVICAVLEPPATPEPDADRNTKDKKKKKDKNRSKTEDKNDPEENKLKSVREEITNTDKTRKTTPTQSVTGNTRKRTS